MRRSITAFAVNRSTFSPTANHSVAERCSQGSAPGLGRRTQLGQRPSGPTSGAVSSSTLPETARQEPPALPLLTAGMEACCVRFQMGRAAVWSICSAAEKVTTGDALGWLSRGYMRRSLPYPPESHERSNHVTHNSR